MRLFVREKNARDDVTEENNGSHKKKSLTRQRRSNFIFCTHLKVRTKTTFQDILFEVDHRKKIPNKYNNLILNTLSLGHTSLPGLIKKIKVR